MRDCRDDFHLGPAAMKMIGQDIAAGIVGGRVALEKPSSWD